ncbi:MAG: hypothetical protein ACHREM_02225 [Polyangiales bacterium]
MATKKKPKTMRYEVQPGRLITRDGEPFITIHKEASARPVEADELTHVIAAYLNHIKYW